MRLSEEISRKKLSILILFHQKQESFNSSSADFVDEKWEHDASVFAVAGLYDRCAPGGRPEGTWQQARIRKVARETFYSLGNHITKRIFDFRFATRNSTEKRACPVNLFRFQFFWGELRNQSN